MGNVSDRGPPEGEVLFLHRDTTFRIWVAVKCPNCGTFEEAEALVRSANGTLIGPYVARREYTDGDLVVVEGQNDTFGQNSGLCEACWEEHREHKIEQYRRIRQVRAPKPMTAKQQKKALKDPITKAELRKAKTRLDTLRQEAGGLAPRQTFMTNRMKSQRRSTRTDSTEEPEPRYSSTPGVKARGLTIDKEIAQKEAEVADLEERWEAKQRAKVVP